MGFIKTRTFYLPLLVICIFMTSGGCAFEEGPFSLRAVSKRLENIWVYSKVYENGIEKTFEFVDQTVDIDSDGEIIIIASFSNTILQGTWTFNDHTDRLYVDLNESSSSAAIRIQAEWIIKRLSNDEFFFEEYTDNKKFRYELVSKK